MVIGGVEFISGYFIFRNGSFIRRRWQVLQKNGFKYWLPEKQMKPWKNKQGYIEYYAHGKTYLAHRIIAIAFIPNPNNYPCINHKNGIKDDNRIQNLEWCTYSQNHLHAYKVLKRKPTWLGKTGSLNPKSKKVNRLNAKGSIILQFASSIEAAIKTGVHPNSISKAIREGYMVKGHRYSYD